MSSVEQAPRLPRSFAARDYLTGDCFQLRQSKEGGFRTHPTPKDIATYYPSLYYGHGTTRRFPAIVEWIQRKLYERRAGLVEAAVGRTGRVLDIGCGPGHLLAAFRRRGWETLGTEIDEAAAAVGRARHNLEVKAGPVEELSLPIESFDAVVSWHTLEHMPNPGEVLVVAAGLLKPNGVLLVSVPDIGSPEAIAAGPAWFHLDVPRHLAHFDAAALRRLLGEVGLTVEAESHAAPEYDLFSLLQTWQNQRGLPHNLLYLLLKGSARMCYPDVKLGQCLRAGLHAALWALPALAVTQWRAWQGTGSVVVISARKVANDCTPGVISAPQTACIRPGSA